MALSMLSAAHVSFQAPAMPVATRGAVSVRMGLESELGATGPLLPYWDPLGLVR